MDGEQGVGSVASLTGVGEGGRRPVDEVVFGRYRLLSVIGEGGMGKVFKAHDTVIGRDVAIKVLPTELGADPEYRQRFRREAHIAARLTEPHIIPIHDTGEIDGKLYLVMPIIDGIDVDGLLQRDGPMDPQRAVHIVEQLAAALDAAHAVGLVHRDIKPSNALVTGHDFVYLIDFGIAHDAAATRLTSAGMMVGTLTYMAPERFTTGVADARSDVYALACVLYECLTGATPYPGESMEQQMAGHVMLDPPRPSERRAEVPVGFDEVIATGMAKDPDQRYQSADQLAAAARHALTSTPSPIPRSAPGSRAAPTRPARRPILPEDQPAPPTLDAAPHQPADPPLAVTRSPRQRRKPAAARQLIQRDKLGVLSKIGQGGQGVVYRAPNVKTKFTTSMVFKEYKKQTVADIDFTALAAMPALVEDSLTYAQAERLISFSAWPCALVEDGGTPTGFVMPAIPEEFFIALTTVKGVSRTAAEFQHLLNHSSVLAARGITLDDLQRYTLLRETASALAFLHKHGVCVGDISPKNLLFSLTPREAVYFIDCDAMRIDTVSALPQVETPGWAAPSGEEVATIYSDAYKLGLLALRLLAGEHDTTNPQHIPSTAPPLLRQIITETLTNEPRSRPLPEAWGYVLGQAIEQAEHQDKTASAAAAPVSIAASSPPVPVLHSRPPVPTAHSAPPMPAAHSTAPVPVAQSGPPIPPPPPPSGRRQFRPGLIAAIAVVVLIVAAGVGIVGYVSRSHSHAPQTPSAQPTAPSGPTVAPVAQAALQGLLLGPDQLDTAMGATGMAVTGMVTALPDGSGQVPDKACIPLEGAGQATVYAGSGWTAVSGQRVADQPHAHLVEQIVVLFSSAQDARAFFAASAQRWPACSNRQHDENTAAGQTQVHTVGPVSNTNGTLSATITGVLARNGTSGTCERALTVANNVAIDIDACGASPSGAAVNIADQIAAKVPTT